MRNLLSPGIQDIRFALRTLGKNPGYTCAALLTLALGIGANTTIYTVIDGALLHPIPFPEPNRLVTLSQKTARGERMSAPDLNLLDWQRQSQAFEAIAALRSDEFTLTGEDRSVCSLLHGLPMPRWLYCLGVARGLSNPTK
jgi:putative ABC transport system permease protein